jgi:formylglycine-generating enzyme required for sulfatase activity
MASTETCFQKRWHVALLRCAAICLIGAGNLSAAGGPGSQQAATPPAYRESITGTLVTFEMVPVPGGTVTVEGKATVVAPFYIGRTETTWDMYDVFALGLDTPTERSQSDASARPSQPYGAPDYGWGHAGYPVISVTRAAAEAFCEWLSKKTGKRYRLPTETEWAHAAALASGGNALTSERRAAIAWHRGNAEARTHPVGTRTADALGLFDLFGNAAEWVTTNNGSLVIRGGSFRDTPEAVGPAARAVQVEAWNERDPQLPKSRWWLSDAPFVGFRIVRDLSTSSGSPRGDVAGRGTQQPSTK